VELALRGLGDAREHVGEPGLRLDAGHVAVRRGGTVVAFLAAAIGVAIRGRRLILGPDIAAFDAQRAVRADADEGLGAGDLSGIVADGQVLEGFERVLDPAQPRARPWWDKPESSGSIPHPPPARWPPGYEACSQPSAARHRVGACGLRPAILRALHPGQSSGRIAVPYGQDREHVLL